MTAFHHPDVTAIVLAAGQGKRMKSDLAKVLHPMAGQPLLGHVLQTLETLGVGRVIVVVGHQRDRVRAAFAASEVEWVDQIEQRGTGHAVMMAGPALQEFEGNLLVVCGDTPLLRAATLHRLLESHRASGSDVTVLSMRLPDPAGYGRMLRDAGGAFTGIVEHGDADAAQRAVDEVNSGIYVFKYPALARVLSGLTAHNAQGEYYLTDTLALLRAEGRPVDAVCAEAHRELLGINTVEQLDEAEHVHRTLGPRGEV